MGTVRDILKSRRQELTGKVVESSGINSLAEKLQILNVSSVLSIMSDYPLAGCHFSIGEDNDDNNAEIGISFQWMNKDRILSEALECYPGKLALKLGYLPIGMCEFGSGDYYYLHIEDRTIENPPLVQIFHDEIDSNNQLTENAVKIISTKLSMILEAAEIY
jgi:hypothetical protein